MVSAISLALHQIQETLQEWMADSPTLSAFLWDKLGREVLLPMAVMVLVMGISVQLLRQLVRFVFPPSFHERHLECKAQYRNSKTKKQIQQALKEWESMDRYPPAYYSRACHYIYVAQESSTGLQILKQAVSQKIIRKNNPMVEQMTLDAQAIAHGNAIMVDMNACLAKQEHLGVTTL